VRPFQKRKKTGARFIDGQYWEIRNAKRVKKKNKQAPKIKLGNSCMPGREEESEVPIGRGGGGEKQGEPS